MNGQSFYDPLSSESPLVKYDYLGTCTTVGVEYPQPQVYVRNWAGHILAELEVTEYSDFLDNFNRPIGFQWVKDLGGSPRDPIYVDLSMTYDQAGNLDTLQDNVLKDASSTPKRNFDGGPPNHKS